MDIRREANRLIGHVGRLAGMDELRLDQRNSCSVVFDGGILCGFYLDEANRTVVMNLVLGGLPGNINREEIMYELLCGNYCWSLTQGGTIGIDRYTGSINLTYPLALPLADGVRFEDIVSKLVGNAAYWMRRLEAFVLPAQPLDTRDLMDKNVFA